MKFPKTCSSFLAGAATALLLCACMGSALAASGRITLNTATVNIAGKTVFQKGEELRTAAGASIPSTILYTDELGGKTHYVPIRRLADALHFPVTWDGSTGTIDVHVTEDLSTYFLPVTPAPYSIEKNGVIYEESAAMAGSGTEVLREEHQSMDGFWKVLELDPKGGQYVTVTVTNNNAALPVRLGMGLCPAGAADEEADGTTLLTTQVPGGETVSRTFRVAPADQWTGGTAPLRLTTEGEENQAMAPCIFVGNPEEVSRWVDVTVSAVQFDR